MAEIRRSSNSGHVEDPGQTVPPHGPGEGHAPKAPEKIDRANLQRDGFDAAVAKPQTSKEAPPKVTQSLSELTKPSMKERVGRFLTEKALPVAGGLAGGAALAAYLIGTGGIGAVVPILAGLAVAGVGGGIVNRGANWVNNKIFGGSSFRGIKPEEAKLKQAIMEAADRPADAEGLFRIPPTQKEVDDVLKKLAKGKTLSKDDLNSTANVTSAYKQIFKDLKDKGTPVLSQSNFEALENFGKKPPEPAEPSARARILEEQLAKMDPQMRIRLLDTLRFMGEFAKKEGTTKMGDSNIGLMLAPNMFADPPQKVVSGDPLEAAKQAKQDNEKRANALTQLISDARQGHLDNVFSKYLPPEPVSSKSFETRLAALSKNAEARLSSEPVVIRGKKGKAKPSKPDAGKAAALKTDYSSALDLLKDPGLWDNLKTSSRGFTREKREGIRRDAESLADIYRQISDLGGNPSALEIRDIIGLIGQARQLSSGNHESFAEQLKNRLGVAQEELAKAERDAKVNKMTVPELNSAIGNIKGNISKKLRELKAENYLRVPPEEPKQGGVYSKDYPLAEGADQTQADSAAKPKEAESYPGVHQLAENPQTAPYDEIEQAVKATMEVIGELGAGNTADKRNALIKLQDLEEHLQNLDEYNFRVTLQSIERLNESVL